MSSKAVILIVLFVLSEVAGIALGEWFFHLFLHAVPPVALSDFNSQSSRIAHWLYGAGVGLALFGWALIGMAISRVTRARPKDEARV
jgi:hypothetical protein